MTQIGSVIDGKYEILKEIGRGGMSIVYLAMDRRLNKQWAVKEIRKKGSGKNDEIIVNSLLAEANLMKRLDHPALPRIVDIIDNGFTIYIIMDYIEGESLDKILAEYGAQPEDQVISWAMQICDALSYLHAQKPHPIIYRDMKPANVMLKPEGNIKIIDFGIAREYKEQNLADTTVLGTKGYAPPEQYSGQTDPRSDIFALGMTMHHLLTGVDPRNGEPYAPVRQRNPELSDGIEYIIDKCVQPAPENRYQSCAELLYDLEHPDLVTKGYRKKQKRKLGLFIAAGAMSLIMLLAGVALKLTSTKLNNASYENMINVASSTAFKDKVASYTQAIKIYPQDLRGYTKLLEAYDSNGRFNITDSQEFLSYYNKYSSTFEEDADTCELRYKLGIMYFKYYTDESGEHSSGESARQALGFFEANYNSEIEYEDKDLNDCYYSICSFYDQYMLGQRLNTKDPLREDFTAIFKEIEDGYHLVQSKGADDKITFCNTVFVLLYDQRQIMAQLDVSKNQALSLFDKAYNEAIELETYQSMANEMKTEIVENYKNYRESIAEAYTAVERSGG